MQRILICGLIMACGLALLDAGAAQAQIGSEADVLDNDQLDSSLKLLPHFDFDDLSTLLKLLESEDAAVRQAAVLSLGITEVITPEARERLKAALDDTDPAVAVTAAWALSVHGFRSSYQVSELQSSDDESKRLLAAKAAVITGEGWRVADETLRELLASDVDDEWIAQISGWLTGEPDIPLIQELIARLADKPGNDTAEHAVQQLFNSLAWAGPESTAFLLESLNHPQTQVRRGAVQGLGSLVYYFNRDVAGNTYNRDAVIATRVDLPGEDGALFLDVVEARIIPALFERLLVEEESDVENELLNALRLCGIPACRMLAAQLAAPTLP